MYSLFPFLKKKLNVYIENDAERYITNGSQQLSPDGGVFFAYMEKIYT